MLNFVPYELCRFIPTAVGNAPCRAKVTRPLAVHPHGCGERLKGYGNSVIPPRFIPTAVGNAASHSFKSRSRSVHPHGCGERGKSDSGSSDPPRFIPTAVGNAFCPGPALGPGPVHPHGCGERIFDAWKCRSGGGSSPRLWGTRWQYGAVFPAHRFIPTAVGNAPIITHCQADTKRRCKKLPISGVFPGEKTPALSISSKLLKSSFGDLPKVLKNKGNLAAAPFMWGVSVFRAGFGRIERHQLEAVQFDWHAAVFAQGEEIKARFGVGAPSQNGVAFLDAFGDLAPNHLPHPRGQVGPCTCVDSDA